ncbi:PucR family transcriptional regulator [Streptomyces enissocaesilis]|uniref:PucR family transcriptional regulator n=2 Tax=Streptomyces enissocaesilis TaxID=332589 RepID=A0ABP6K145_9ACTN
MENSPKMPQITPLGLPLHDGAAHSDQKINDVVITELRDPRPLLEGGELVLTTGERQHEEIWQRLFTENVIRGNAAAIGFVTGLRHTAAPAAMLEIAEQSGLPVLEIPSRSLLSKSSRLQSPPGKPQGASLPTLSEHQRRMLDEVVAGRGIPGVLNRLSEATGAPTAVLDLSGAGLDHQADSYDWSTHRLHDQRLRMTTIDPPHAKTLLLSMAHSDVAAELQEHAAQLIHVELGRTAAFQAGRRELAGQIIEDVVRDALSGAEAGRKLVTIGIDPGASHSVLLVRSDDEAASHAAQLTLSRTAEVVADVGAYGVGVMRGPQSAAEWAGSLARHGLEGQDLAVGIGGPYPGVQGLRWAFLEAQEAAAHGSGVHQGRLPNMVRLLMCMPDLPLREVAHKAMQPLVDFDALHTGELVRTLTTFLDSGCSPQQTARELFVHRNTVRYRLEQIERLTGLSLASTENRVHLWLASQLLA